MIKNSWEKYKAFCKREGLSPSRYESLKIFIMSKK